MAAATAAALLIPSMAILILLLLHPTPHIAALASSNQTSSNWFDAEQSTDSEFLMDSEIRRMLVELQTFQTGSTKNASEPAVPDCNRPPRYDSCLGEKRSTPPPENCGTFNRAFPSC